MSLRSFACAIVVMVLGASASAQSPAADAPQPNDVISEADITKAIVAVQADPNLAGERKTRVLKWSAEEEKPEETKNQSRPAWLKWIGQLFRWFGESARVFVWVAAALVIGVLIVSLIRIVRGADLKRGVGFTLNAPTHVRDLDIRPESLPDDIGRAALELWERGDHRASLSLLYRGLLSRLVHVHNVPIKHSSTEGECRALALQHLPSHCHEYVALLIRIWQGAVYGAREPDDETARRLCRQFASALGAASNTQDAAMNPSGAAA